jgi:hypothetical protein
VRLLTSDHLNDLQAQAEYARQRYELYKAKSYGPRPTSSVRMRELERAWEQAQARLRAAQAQERGKPGETGGVPDPS